MWKLIITTSGVRVYVLMLGMISVFLSSRYIGPDGRGTFVAITGWAGMLANLVSFSVGDTLHYKTKLDRNNISELLWSLITILLVVSFVTLTSVLFLYKVTDGNAFGRLPYLLFAMGLLIIPFRIFEWYSRNIFLVFNDIKKINRAQIYGSTLGITFTASGLISGIGLYAVVFGALFGQITLSLYSLYYLVLKSERIVTSIKTIKTLLVNGLKLHLSVIGTTLIGQMDILTLNQFGSKSDLGLYQIAYQLVTILLILTQSVSTILFGKMNASSPDKVWEVQKRIIKQLLLVLLILSIVSYFLSPYLIPLFFGKAFTGSVEIFQWLLVSLLGMSLSNLLTNQWVGRGYFFLLSIITVMIGLLNFFLNYIFIPIYGVLGAVYATILSFTMYALINICFSAWINHHVSLSMKKASNSVIEVN